MGGVLVDDGSGVLGYTVDVAELAHTVCSVLHPIGIVPPRLNVHGGLTVLHRYSLLVA
jgi:hypothetical protein